MLDALIVVTVLAAGAVLWLPRLRNLPAWRAMTTPLASIIGSGFLLLGPILTHAYGAWAPVAMVALCLLAWAFGAAVRVNIAVIEEEGEGRPKLERWLDRAGALALGFAYMISVAYYLNLFGAFGLSLTPWPGRIPAQFLTTAMYVVIVTVGFTYGFRMLERLEYVSVSMKLAIIAGLILALAVHFGDFALDGRLVVLPMRETGWHAVALGFGLIVTVQGFETARFLGATYKAPVRIKAMRWAQILSSIIYVAYIGCFAYIFSPEQTELKETAIVDMMGSSRRCCRFFWSPPRWRRSSRQRWPIPAVRAG